MAAFLALHAPLAHAQDPDPQHPGLGLRLLDIPAYQQGDTRAGSAVVDAAMPGTTVVRHIRVENRTGQVEPVDVYVGPAKIEQPQGFMDLPRGDQNELSSWSTVDKSKMTMADNEVQDVTLTINVPKDATEGERYAVFWAEMQSQNAKDSMGVKLVNRIGTRIYLTVGPGNGPTPKFQIDSLTPRKNARGTHEVVVHVSNTGERAVDLHADLSLSAGPGGLSMDERTSPGTVTLAPGQAGDVIVDLGVALPAGKWHAKVKVRSGSISETKEADLVFPESGTGATVKIDNSTPSSIPWPLLIGAATSGAALVAIIALVLALLRRRRGSHQPKS